MTEEQIIAGLVKPLVWRAERNEEGWYADCPLERHHYYAAKNEADKAEVENNRRARIAAALNLGPVVALVGAAGHRPMIRVCTTTGGPSHEGEKWVHKADYDDLRKRLDAALAAFGGSHD